MKKLINKGVHLILGLTYAAIGYHSLTIMYILLTNAKSVETTICAIVTDILWTGLLFVCGVLLYSIIFTKTKTNGTN